MIPAMVMQMFTNKKIIFNAEECLALFRIFLYIMLKRISRGTIVNFFIFLSLYLVFNYKSLTTEFIKEVIIGWKIYFILFFSILVCIIDNLFKRK